MPKGKRVLSAEEVTNASSHEPRFTLPKNTDALIQRIVDVCPKAAVYAERIFYEIYNEIRGDLLIMVGFDDDAPLLVHRALYNNDVVDIRAAIMEILKELKEADGASRKDVKTHGKSQEDEPPERP